VRLRRDKEIEQVEQAPDRPRPMEGVRFERADQGRRLAALREPIREFPPIEGYSMWNGAYESVDAEVLWGIIRQLQPTRVLQLGRSEWASMIIAAALKANGTGERDYGTDPRDLGDRDVLFAGRPETAIVLDVLPRLQPGVVVHFHGIRLPWQGAPEQDLLQAFLSGNEDWEVVLGLYDLTRSEPELVRDIVPSWRGTTKPSAFWLRRC
jgi:hypothetical protein